MSSEKISPATPTGAAGSSESPERWSAARKTALAVRLLRGEPLNAVARDSQVPVHELEEWRRAFLDGGTASVKKGVDPETFFIGGMDGVEREFELFSAQWPAIPSSRSLRPAPSPRGCLTNGGHTVRASSQQG